MARPTKLLAAVRDVVRREVADAMQALLSFASAKPTKKKRRRRKRRGPGRPPKTA